MFARIPTAEALVRIFEAACDGRPYDRPEKPIPD
jgi:hypothetical protein